MRYTKDMIKTIIKDTQEKWLLQAFNNENNRHAKSRALQLDTLIDVLDHSTLETANMPIKANMGHIGEVLTKALITKEKNIETSTLKGIDLVYNGTTYEIKTLLNSRPHELTFPHDILVLTSNGIYHIDIESAKKLVGQRLNRTLLKEYGQLVYKF